MKKIAILLLILCVCLSFCLLMSCDGSSSGSSSDENEDPPAVIWPVRYLAENPEVEGTYIYIAFKQDGTFTAGESIGSYDVSILGAGTYTGDDPHGDGTITMSGYFGETPLPLEEKNYIIVDGVLSFLGVNWERQ